MLFHHAKGRSRKSLTFNKGKGNESLGENVYLSLKSPVSSLKTNHNCRN